MKIEQLDIPPLTIEFLQKSGYVSLYPPQEKTVKAGLLEGKSILVSAPTASGKTLIAILAIIKHLSEKRGKVIYLSPLKALASEKFNEFKKLGSDGLGKNLKIQISTGDFDMSDKNLGQNDILVLTNEKMDSIIRQGAEWLDQISLVIADEVHLLGDDDRGPTLEIVLTKMKLLPQKPQILALSATVTNADEIADWLGCELVLSEWRPVPLSEGVYDQGIVTMQDRKKFEVQTSIRGPPVDLGLDSLNSGGQAILFAETRARSVSLATKASEAVLKTLNTEEKEVLGKISQKILDDNEHTELVKTLAGLIKNGVAFHHAGLNPNCRDLIESEFRNRRIKILASTPTLAAGVNLPARRVVIANMSRYDAKYGVNKPISILEYKQLCGRAGRPQYDKYGEAIIVGNSNSDEIFDYYINGTPEPISSKLTGDKALRIHLLSFISTNPGIKGDDIVEFFSKTLSGSQERKTTIKFHIQISLRYLESEELVKQKGNRYIATDFGKKTSTLYIDPLTAVLFRKSLEKISTQGHVLGLLHLITISEDFFPKFSLRNKDYEFIGTLIENYADQLIEPISEYDCNRSLLAIHAWINESSEIFLSDNFGIESGDMHRMVETTDWLIHSLYEIAKLEKKDEILTEIDSLRSRVAYGIKEELGDLVQVKGIGRVRARVLFKNGIKTREDLTSISVEKLAKMDKIGPIVAENIKTHLKKIR
ncbi:DEAD/DEAH box helicase [Candidatus Nitrosotalea okcheonensis]|uniref:ATP-dependent DNA helicase Hel308 n=1 Tax=Candidatus Nitrosotalea okcheonensis TaxID=1903276 RepID=A0A2H1FGC6_9ARCH|nr:DEAD/DEAH box helicase [Candidatus Nitrosotalea okcheonensis]SMH71825.1 putative ski2-type helicase [Candidatus Nitrosotalea okcheonensis]